MQRRHLLKTTILATAFAVSGLGAAWAENADKLKIGFVGVTSGPAAAWGTSNVRSMETLAAMINEQGGDGLHGPDVRGAPGGRRAAGDADEADLELVGVLGEGRSTDAAERSYEGDGFQKVASLHRILSPDRCHSKRMTQGDGSYPGLSTILLQLVYDPKHSGWRRSANAHRFGTRRSIA